MVLLLLLVLRNDATTQGQRSMAVARSLGVKMCYGSDLLGALHK
jgi:hypothetical protein